MSSAMYRASCVGGDPRVDAPNGAQKRPLHSLAGAMDESFNEASFLTAQCDDEEDEREISQLSENELCEEIENIKVNSQPAAVLAPIETSAAKNPNRKRTKTESAEIVAPDDASYFLLPPAIQARLYDYQITGVKFLRFLYHQRTGGVLADDMGLGKTFQSLAFVSGLFHGNNSALRSSQLRVLIVAPLSVLPQWMSACNAHVVPYFGNQGGVLSEYRGPKRQQALTRIKQRGGVMISTFETVSSNSNELTTAAGFKWDFVIVDEAHQIKNPNTRAFAALRQVSQYSRSRVAMTGTPVQNELNELWALFDFAANGKLLGERQDFVNHFARDIELGQSKNASAHARLVGSELSTALRNVIRPYLLRREKSVVLLPVIESKEVPLETREEREIDDPPLREEASRAIVTTAPAETKPETLKIRPIFEVCKLDLILWVNLNQSQRIMYEEFLASPVVRTALNQTSSPLAALTVLQKICDQPQSLYKSASGASSAATESLGEGAKMEVLTKLLHTLCEEGGHKTIVFSKSTRVLENISTELRRNKKRRLNHLLVTGRLSSDTRAERVRAFNEDVPVKNDALSPKLPEDESWNVLLLTTKVGSLGLDIASASRVIIYDASWNPAVDSQACDRAFRLGQKNNVVIYRLVTSGTIEEKMMRTQVKKSSIARMILSEADAEEASSRPLDLSASSSHHIDIQTLEEADEAGEHLRDLFTLSSSSSGETKTFFESLSLHHDVRLKASSTFAAHAALFPASAGRCQADSGEIQDQLNQLCSGEPKESALSQLKRNDVVLGLSDFAETLNVIERLARKVTSAAASADAAGDEAVDRALDWQLKASQDVEMKVE